MAKIILVVDDKSGVLKMAHEYLAESELGSPSCTGGASSKLQNQSFER